MVCKLCFCDEYIRKDFNLSHLTMFTVTFHSQHHSREWLSINITLLQIHFNFANHSTIIAPYQVGSLLHNDHGLLVGAVDMLAALRQYHIQSLIKRL